jgi:hypothetical protein
MKTEKTVLKQCMLAATEFGARVWRNNVGLFETVDGRKVRTGLCKGSADLVGLTAGGRFLAVECKRPGGRLRKEQKQWLDVVAEMGGLAVVADDAEKLKEALKKENA